ncbi:MAG: nucleotidyltransferase domain-containing protein [Thermodesulfovibrionales bacterium]|nr:nucleotidyltransferase domain-containing protein [Thermodesulfovibrionales bacterium]
MIMRKRRLSGEERGYLIERIAAILKEKEYVLFAYIFGSFASGESFNDIDVGIFISGERLNSPLRLELEMERELEDAVRIPVDIRIINNAPPSFIYNVLKSGLVIVDNNKSLRADFEGLVYKKYFDFQHLRNEYLREIINAPLQSR